MASRKPVEEMRQEVHRLRGQCLSFSRVAEDLGISKAYAVKLSKAESVTASDTTSDTNRSPRPVASDRPAMTVRERKFAKGLLEGKTQRQASMDAAPPGTLTPSGADSYADRTLKDERFRETFEQLLDRKGLSEERIAEVHAENLQATKVVATATKEGQITDIIERPDYATRQRAVQAGWSIHGRDRNDDFGKSNPVIIVVSAETKRKAEQLAGYPLEAIQARDDESAGPVIQINEPEPSEPAASVVEAEEYPQDPDQTRFTRDSW